MPYKYKSVLKNFTYSSKKYKVVSDFLIDGLKSNPDIKIKIDEITKTFKPKSKSRDWFRISTTKAFISALINIKLDDGDKKLENKIRSWLKSENIDNKVFYSEWVQNPLTQNNDTSTLFDSLEEKNYYEKQRINLELLSKSEDNKLMKLLKEIGLVEVKKGNLKGSKNGKSIQGTWIHRDLAVKYAEWLDPEFSIWISKKIQELVSDGISWNELRDLTKMDYKPLTLSIKTNIVPLYPKLDYNIVYGKIANYINCRVIGKKAKDIRDEKGIEPHELTRDFFTKEQLDQIEKVQIFAEILISQFDIYDFKTLKEKISQYKLT
jgi:hypothetical protein